MSGRSVCAFTNRRLYLYRFSGMYSITKWRYSPPSQSESNCPTYVFSLGEKRVVESHDIGVTQHLHNRKLPILPTHRLETNPLCNSCLEKPSSPQQFFRYRTLQPRKQLQTFLSQPPLLRSIGGHVSDQQATRHPMQRTSHFCTHWIV